MNSRSSSSSRYDPEILKAEIITAKSRVRDDQHINKNQSPILAYNPYCCIRHHTLTLIYLSLSLSCSLSLSQVNRLKRDLSSMKQELQFKQQGFETLKEWVLFILRAN